MAAIPGLLQDLPIPKLRQLGGKFGDELMASLNIQTVGEVLCEAIVWQLLSCSTECACARQLERRYHCVFSSCDICQCFCYHSHFITYTHISNVDLKCLQVEKICTQTSCSCCSATTGLLVVTNNRVATGVAVVAVAVIDYHLAQLT